MSHSPRWSYRAGVTLAVLLCAHGVASAQTHSPQPPRQPGDPSVAGEAAPPASPAAAATGGEPDYWELYQQKQADLRRERERRRQQALQRRARREAVLRQPRILLSVGYAGGFAARVLDGSLRERLRLRGATVGIGYRQHFARSVGLHLMATGAIGSTTFTLRDAGYEFDYDRSSERMGTGFAAELEAGPLIGAFGPFYLAPLLHARTWWPPGSGVTLRTDTVDASTERTLHFDAPVVLGGLRLLLGFMPGDTHAPDIGFGIDFGAGLREVDRYVGIFLRGGIHLPTR